MNFAKNTSKLTACLVALLFGGIGVLAYSPFDYWFVAFLSASGLMWLIFCNDKATALLGSFLWAVAYYTVGVQWVHVSMIQFGGVPEIVSYLAVLLLAAYLALYTLLFAYSVHRFKLFNPWAMAALFMGAEYLRGVVFTGFPWLQFGYTMIDSPFSGLAPILGVEGLNFFVVLTSGYVVQIVWNVAKRVRNLTACSAVMAAVWATSFLSFVEVDEQQKPLQMSLVQGNIEQKMKWDPAHFDETIKTYQRLIGEVLGRSEVIILPESAIPATEQQISPLLQHLDYAGRNYGSELIIGTLYDGELGLFNSAVVLGQETFYNSAQSPRFNKHHLVPFGEYVPFGNLLDWMREVFVLPVNLSQGDFVQPPLTAANKQFNMAICYEIIFGHQVQQNQKYGNADYLLTISNDAWFGTSIGPWQHFQMARMRALELGKPLIRATNTGITAFVDAFGRVVAQAPQFEATTLTYAVPAVKGQTPFSQIGHWGIYGASIAIVLLFLVRRRKA